MSSPTILMELYLGGSWVDITSKVRKQAGITVKRGRTNEASNPDAGELTFTVDNSDGRFTIGKTDGPYGANFVKFVKCRYSVNGAVRYCGYIIKAPTAWASLTTLADATITCTDLQGILELSPDMLQWATDSISALSPAFWWRFDDAQGSTSAAPAAGGVPLVGAFDAITQSWGLRVADLVEFGVDPPDGVDAGTQGRLVWVDTDAGDTAKAYLWGVCTSSSLSTYTVAFIYTPGDGVSDQIVRLRSGASGTSWLDISRTRSARLVIGDGNGEGSANFAYIDGFFQTDTPTLIAVSVSGTTASIVGTSTKFTSSYLPSFSGGAEVDVRSKGLISHLVIVPGVMSASTLGALKAKLVGSGSVAASVWLQRCMDQAGIGTAPIMRGDDPQMLRPTMLGGNPNSPGLAMATASGSMWIAARDQFAMTWIDHSYCPARADISALPGGGLTWDDDASLAYTDVTVDGVLAFSGAGFPRATRDIPGLMPSRADFLSWLQGTAAIWSGPRLSGLSYDLMAMDSTTLAAVLALDIKSRIYPLPATLPPQLPIVWVHTIEGYTETVTESSWTFAPNAAPDPRFVLDDSVAGVLDSNYRIGY